MAYIAPNSTVKILRSISIDNSYRNTILQSDKASQYSMFNAYTKYSLTNYSYQRVNKGAIRVDILADNLYDCNYMMFQNTAYGNKWFYAFITNVNYINDNASEIEYEIDVMQTWYFDYDLGRCLVEREHTLTDNLGENLIEEDINTGESFIRVTDEYIFSEPNRFHIVIYYVANRYIYSVDENGAVHKEEIPQISAQGGNIENGVYTGAQTIAFQMPSINSSQTVLEIQMNSLIKEMLNDGTHIVKIVQVPSLIWNARNNALGFSAHKVIEQPATFKDVVGTATYTPKNKKMYTYPFQSLVFTNCEGQASELKWELFTTNNGTTKSADFHIQGVVNPLPSCMATPTAYRGTSYDYDSGLILQDFPDCSWSEDSYAKWWNANKVAINASIQAFAVKQALGVVSDLVGAGNSLADPYGIPANVGYEAQNFAGRTASRMGQTALFAWDIINQKRSARNIPDTLSGSLTANSIRVIQDRYGFRFYCMAITADTAKAIDDYFTMYGYACKRVKVPYVKDITVSHSQLRPYWNYVKTIGCNVLPAGWSAGKPVGLPQDAMNLISKIYDNGITFWDNLVRVGNYSLTNSARG